MRITFLNDSIREILSGEFSSEAKITLQNPPGSVKFIRVLPRFEFSQESVMDVEREAYNYYCECCTDDLKDVQQDDVIRINEQDYNIEIISHKANNWSTLILSKK